MNPILLVTGGSRGIGAATALLAAERGYSVCLTYKDNRDAAQTVVAGIERKGGRAMAVAADVGVERDVLQVFERIDKELGRITALVNNAGILEHHMRLDAMTVDRWQRVLTANVVGTFLCAREAVKRMSTKFGGAGGAIVNVSSMAARLGSPNEYIDYAASKGAVDTLTIGLAKEVAAEGIRVNGVRPGLIYTDIHASGGEPNRVERIKGTVPMQRGGRADEVAAAILFLLSDEASYSTGTFVDVSGGR